MKKQIKKWQSC